MQEFSVVAFYFLLAAASLPLLYQYSFLSPSDVIVVSLRFMEHIPIAAYTAFTYISTISIVLPFS